MTTTLEELAVGPRRHGSEIEATEPDRSTDARFPDLDLESPGRNGVTGHTTRAGEGLSRPSPSAVGNSYSPCRVMPHAAFRHSSRDASCRFGTVPVSAAYS